MQSSLTRRRFLKASALAIGATGLAPRSLLADEKKASPNERLHVGVIGVTNQAAYDWGQVEATGLAEIVALCDVDENVAGPVREHFSKASFDVDFRKMLDRKGIDAVIVATPDHTHAVATVAALKSGRHVYCEKPLTHDVYEARVVAETAAKEKRITQMGTQIHAGDNYRRVVELIQTGAVGDVNEVHVWCNTSWGGGERPKGGEPVPAGLHWDLWLGTAPERPYFHGNADKKGHGVYHRYNWRRFWDFGGGTLADMGCHYMDLGFWSLKLRHPTRIAADVPKPNAETGPVSQTVHYEFPARGELPAVKLTWYDGGRRPQLFEQGALPDWKNGVLFVGAKGMLIADYNRRMLLPEKQFADFKPPEPFIPKSIGHHREWIEAIRTGSTTTCNFDYAGALTEAVLLGVVSHRCGQPLEWDAKNMRVTNTPEADRFLRREYRKGWTL
jgi:predicted dehydrogenase